MGRAPTDAEVAASNADPGGDAPEDLVVDRRCTLASVSGHTAGILEVGWLTMPTASERGLGVGLGYVRGDHGGDGKHRFVRASWATVDPRPDGTLRVTETVARFETATCKVLVARRYSAVARPILGGRAYAFLTRCPSCDARSRRELHAITAGGGDRFGVAEFTHHVVPFEPGAGHRLEVRLGRHDLMRFERAFRVPEPLPPPGSSVRVGVEAVEALGEASPTVIGYVTDEPDPLF